MPHTGGLDIGDGVPIGLAPAAVLALADADRLRRIEIDDDDMGIHRRRRIDAGVTRLDHHAVPFLGDLDGNAHALRALVHMGERIGDGGTAGAVDMGAPVDDRLRRIDRTGAESAHIGILALGVLLAAQRVLPAEIIPVVDVIGQCDDVLPGHEVGEKLVGRRAGTAALVGEELDHAQRAVAVADHQRRAAATRHVLGQAQHLFGHGGVLLGQPGAHRVDRERTASARASISNWAGRPLRATSP